MQFRRLFGVSPRWGRRALAVTLVCAGVGAVLWVTAGSAPPLRGAGSGAAGQRSGSSLSRAPGALQAAVRRTLGVPAASASAFQHAELTGSDAANGDNFGWSVAISGSTAVVGEPYKDSLTGAAYVFVRLSNGWSEQTKLTATHGIADREFGYSVAISGSTAVIGAPNDASLTHPGAAYVFVRSGMDWSQQAKLTASDGTGGDEFGFSVAISGSTAVVGTHRTSNTKAAYVFTKSGNTWSQRAKLRGSAADPEFGYSVAISGSTVVVGAPDKNSNTGAAYVFVRSGSTWSQQAKLTASDPAATDFGYSVAISGPTVVVGAPGRDVISGAAYVFVRSGSTWSQQAELTASDGTSFDGFGGSVAISGSMLVVSASGTDSETGVAYVFVQSGSTWSQQAKLSASGTTAGDLFGNSVAISGSTAVVGAPGTKSNTGTAYVFVLPSREREMTVSDGAAKGAIGYSVAISKATAVVGAPDNDSNTGAAYVFVRSGSTWSQQAKLTASDATAGDLFGNSVAISGSTAVVGAPDKNSGRGAAYVFVRSGVTWSQQAKLSSSSAVPNDLFGYSVAISGSTAVAGAPDENSDTGAAYVFAQSGGTWSQRAKLTASDAAAGEVFGLSVAISGSTAVVGAPLKNSKTGAVYVFSGRAWTRQAKLAASDAAAGDLFGAAVAISRSRVAVGAPSKNSKTGEAYVFSRGAWSRQTELTASDAARGDEFGWSVAISGSTAVVGTPFKNFRTGAAYVFAQSGRAWSQQAKMSAADTTAGDEFGWSVAISGSTTVVGAPSRDSYTGATYPFGSD